MLPSANASPITLNIHEPMAIPKYIKNNENEPCKILLTTITFFEAAICTLTKNDYIKLL